MFRESIKWITVTASVLGLHATLFAFTVREPQEIQASEELAGGVAITVLDDIEIAEPEEPVAAEPVAASIAEPVQESLPEPRESMVPEPVEAPVHPIVNEESPPEPELMSQQQEAAEQLKQELAKQRQREAEQQARQEQEKQRKLAAARARQATLAKKIVTAAKPGNNSRHIPHYPRTLRRRGIEGTVVLQVKVDASGAVCSINVKQSSGHKSFDQSALRAVKNWSYCPAINGLGSAIASTKIERIVYQLQ